MLNNNNHTLFVPGIFLGIQTKMEKNIEGVSYFPLYPFSRKFVADLTSSVPLRKSERKTFDVETNDWSQPP